MEEMGRYSLALDVLVPLCYLFEYALEVHDYVARSI